jgi:hypothetical protein
MITRDHGTVVKMTYMFLVAVGGVATSRPAPLSDGPGSQVVSCKKRL